MTHEGTGWCARPRGDVRSCAARVKLMPAWSLPAIPFATYRVRVNVNERDEISASVAAHAELGPRYDSAVAEGLVERIGDEIDKRIDARLRGQAGPGQQDNYGQPPAYQGPAAPVPARPAAAPPPAQVPSRAGGLSGVILGLGSMG